MLARIHVLNAAIRRNVARSNGAEGVFDINPSLVRGRGIFADSPGSRYNSPSNLRYGETDEYHLGRHDGSGWIGVALGWIGLSLWTVYDVPPPCVPLSCPLRAQLGDLLLIRRGLRPCARTRNCYFTAGIKIRRN